MHALLACETLTASLFHFIHRQIVSGYSDPKLLEMLFYTLLTLCNFDALHASSSIPQGPTDVDAFRRWLDECGEGSKEKGEEEDAEGNTVKGEGKKEERSTVKGEERKEERSTVKGEERKEERSTVKGEERSEEGNTKQSTTGCLRDLLWREVKAQEAPQGRRVVDVRVVWASEA